jgi:toxin ParE1/3/4
VTRRKTLWTIRLTESAQADFQDIVHWTAELFGEAQARSYARTLSLALQSLTAGPAIAGTRARDDIIRGLMTLHVARQGRKGRHFVMFRVNPREAQTLDVLRILHDAMDLPEHV